MMTAKWGHIAGVSGYWRVVLLLTELALIPGGALADACRGFSHETISSGGSVAYGACLSDLNGDGAVDLAVTNTGVINVSVMMNDGDGAFGSPTKYKAMSSPTFVCAADTDLDADLDLVVVRSSWSFGEVWIMPNNGDGTFDSPQKYSVGSNPYAAAVADLNGDGHPDIAVPNSNSRTVSVLMNNGDGTFASQKTYSAGSFPLWPAIADFNGDGYPDLAVANADQGGKNISILLNHGDGTFADPVKYAAGSAPQMVIALDLNGDAQIDLAVANAFSDDVSILLNNGDGTFADQVRYAAGDGPISLCAGDFNGDGLLDLVVADFDGDTISILLGNGDATFDSPISYAVGDGPQTVATADIDGDGELDLITANNYWGSVTILKTVLLDLSQQPAPQSVSVGETATFSVGAQGTAPITYQWRSGDNDLSDGATDSGSIVSGSATANLTIENVQLADAGQYAVFVSNSCGTIESDPAQLSVAPLNLPGDANCDGLVDFNDIDPFVIALISRDDYESRYPACNYLNNDINADRAVDFNDIDPFVTCLINNGCP